MRLLREFLIAAAVFLVLALSASAVSISSCGTLNNVTSYSLTQDVTSSATCFTITAPDVTLNCNGYEIRFDNTSTGGAGISITGASALIQNCKIRDLRGGGRGISISPSASGTNNDYLWIANNNITTNGSGTGIYFIGNGGGTSNFVTNYTRIQQNTIRSVEGAGSSISIYSASYTWQRSGTVNHLTLDRNYFEQPVSFAGVNNTVIENNQFGLTLSIVSTWGTGYTGAQNTDITDNSFGGEVSLQNGLYDGEFSSNTIICPSVTTNCSFALQINAVRSPVNYNNILFSQTGMYISNQDSEIVGNILNYIPLPTMSADSAFILQSSAHNLIANNTIIANTSASVLYHQSASHDNNLTGNKFTNFGSGIPIRISTTYTSVWYNNTFYNNIINGTSPIHITIWTGSGTIGGSPPPNVPTRNNFSITPIGTLASMNATGDPYNISQPSRDTDGDSQAFWTYGQVLLNSNNATLCYDQCLSSDVLKECWKSDVNPYFGFYTYHSSDCNCVNGACTRAEKNILGGTMFGGNYYGNSTPNAVSDWSRDCTDSNQDGFCDTTKTFNCSGYGFGSAYCTSAYSNFNQDYYPLSRYASTFDLPEQPTTSNLWWLFGGNFIDIIQGKNLKASSPGYQFTAAPTLNTSCNAVNLNSVSLTNISALNTSSGNATYRNITVTFWMKINQSFTQAFIPFYEEGYDFGCGGCQDAHSLSMTVSNVGLYNSYFEGYFNTTQRRVNIFSGGGTGAYGCCDWCYYNGVCGSNKAVSSSLSAKYPWDSNWHFIAFTSSDNNTLSLYVDGLFVHSVHDTTGFHRGAKVVVNKDQSGNFSIADFRIFTDTAVSEAELVSIYNNPVYSNQPKNTISSPTHWYKLQSDYIDYNSGQTVGWTDIVPHNSSGTALPSFQSSAPANLSGSLLLPNNTYTANTLSDGDGYTWSNMTVAYWVKYTGTWNFTGSIYPFFMQGNCQYSVIARVAPYGNLGSFFSKGEENAQTLHFTVGSNGGACDAYCPPCYQPYGSITVNYTQDNNWHHILMQTVSPGNTTLYMDGVKVGTFLDEVDTGTRNGYNNPIYLNYAYNAELSIADLRFYFNSNLSANDIATLGRGAKQCSWSACPTAFECLALYQDFLNGNQQWDCTENQTTQCASEIYNPPSGCSFVASPNTNTCNFTVNQTPGGEGGINLTGNLSVMQNLQFKDLIPHKFYVSFAVNNSNGASQVNGRSISYDSGTCTYTSNSSVGKIFNVTYTCTGTPHALNTVMITVSDDAESIGSNSAAYAYPNSPPTANWQSPLDGAVIPSNTTPLVATAYDVESDSITSWKWFVNGELYKTTSSGSTTLTGYLHTIYLQVSAFDSYDWGANDSIIVNLTGINCFDDNCVAPGISNLIINNTPITNIKDAMVSWTYTDADANPQTAYNVFWFKNGQMIASANNSLTLLFSNYTTGDRIRAMVNVSDGKFTSGYSNTSELTVGDNSPPIFNNLTISDTAFYSDEALLLTVNCSDQTTGGSGISAVYVTINNSGVLENRSLSQSTGNLFVYVSTFGVGTYSTPFGFCIDGNSNINITSFNESVYKFTSSTRPSTGPYSPPIPGGESGANPQGTSTPERLFDIRSLAGGNRVSIFMSPGQTKTVQFYIVNTGNTTERVTLQCQNKESSTVDACYGFNADADVITVGVGEAYIASFNITTPGEMSSFFDQVQFTLLGTDEGGKQSVLVVEITTLPGILSITGDSVVDLFSFTEFKAGNQKIPFPNPLLFFIPAVLIIVLASRKDFPFRLPIVMTLIVLTFFVAALVARYLLMVNA